ncbi:hypothetical protein HNQ80_005232, partial [Anaerosolibacter carboniphilus]
GNAHEIEISQSIMKTLHLLLNPAKNAIIQIARDKIGIISGRITPSRKLIITIMKYKVLCHEHV